MKVISIFIVFILSIQIYLSQNSLENEFPAWHTIDGTHAISENLSTITGVQLRTYKTLDNINLIFYYTGINYNLSKKLLVSTGYYYIDIDRSFDDTNTPHIFENTIFEQIAYYHTIGKLSIYHKLRMENRFLRYMGTTTTSNRFRYCLGTKIKINNLLYVNANNEFFANLKGTFCNENRLYGALGINISKANSIQLGYMNHKINGLNLHTLQTILLIKTDLSKKY
ncbi:DUF2490 domain-containing protein [Confluentibacter citreus]|uniref:DUF2490 domain-containing protein n=1 Tax=Confluentibacter citreus TaxID=2007307 RepID=UPI000C2854FB|nr:DUF2490 domain-containing protein [Confluentibacter citreus]